MTPNLSNFKSLGKKIVCVGRNFKDHAAELGNPVPKQPLFFLKATSSYVSEGQPIIIPPGCQKLHQEVELGVIFSRIAKNVPRERAFDHIGGYTVALDMTARDFQDQAKQQGTPWFIAKSFDTSCPTGSFIEAKRIADPHNICIYCSINGDQRQCSKTDAMIFNIPTLIEYLTRYITMEPGDLLLTGTPPGVCQVNSGDTIEIGIRDITKATFSVQ